MKCNYDDTFLARWVNNELTQDELSEFERSKDFELYTRILDRSSELTVPNFENEELLKKIKSKLATKNTRKAIKLKTNWYYSAAASIAIIFGLFYFLDNSTSYSTDFGEQMAIILPDNSEVTLNSKSKISFDKGTWKNARNITLKGEAFFKVEKGSTFSVNSSQGSVQVLGTQFNVNTNKNYFEIKCFEGKVKVNSAKDEVILTKGMAYRIINKQDSESWNFSHISPTSWRNGESTFNNTPLKEVIKSLQNHYKLKITGINTIDTEKRFTGSFTHNNLQVAIQTVFVPMKIGVTFTEENSISVVNK